MLRDITLGQFFPGNTFIHRLDPRTKLLAVILYIVALFNAQGVVTYAIVTALLALCIIVSRVPFRSLTRGLKPIWVIVAFTAIMNLFFTSGTPLGAGWLLSHISQEGLRSAIFMVLRIVMLIMGTFLLTYTTSPISLTDGLESLLSPPEEAASARPRAGHDDVHRPALYPHPHRGDGQDHVCPEGPGRGL